MLRLSFFIGLLILCSKPALAVELDQLQINSFINEPLNASIPVLGVDEYELADLKFTLASRQDYRKLLGTARPRHLDKIKLKVILNENNRHELRITSHQRVREPILTFLLKVTDRQGSFIRTYTLLMDPRTEPTAEPPEETKPIVLTEVTSFQEDADHPAPKPLDDRERILVGDRSISIIAQNLDLHEKFSVYQIMRALYLENPEAFEKGNINKLTSGTTLFIPPDSLIGEVSRRKAVNFVYSVSKDHITDPVPTAEPLSESIRRDNEYRRRTPDEIAANAHRPGSPDKASRNQDDELASMAAKMSQQNQPTLQLEMRPNEPTASQQTGDVRTIGSEPPANAPIDDQNSTNADQEDINELVNQQVNQINSDIAQIKSGLDVLIENNPDPANLLTPDSERAALAEDIEENTAPIPVSTAALDSGDIPRLWIVLIVISAALMFALREWTWQRRFKALLAQANKEAKSHSSRETLLSRVGNLAETRPKPDEPLPKIDVETNLRTPLEGMPLEVDFETQTQSTLELNLQEVDIETNQQFPPEEMDLEIEIEAETQSPPEEPFPEIDAEPEARSPPEAAFPEAGNATDTQSSSEELLLVFEIDAETEPPPEETLAQADHETETQSPSDELPLDIDIDAVFRTPTEEPLPEIDIDTETQTPTEEPLPEIDIDTETQSPPEKPPPKINSEITRRTPRKQKPSPYKPSNVDIGEFEIRDLGESIQKSAGFLDSADKPQHKVTARSVDEFIQECDMLIAYELYTEALQLVNASRDNLDNDPWLGIKELEVLAASGQNEAFFDCYDQHKKRLKQKLPEPWKEIYKIFRRLRRRQKNCG